MIRNALLIFLSMTLASCGVDFPAKRDWFERQSQIGTSVIEFREKMAKRGIDQMDGEALRYRAGIEASESQECYQMPPAYLGGFYLGCISIDDAGVISNSTFSSYAYW
ncbi:hypothetical protein SAMN05444358_10948 [Ruegeria halocynthiae]|uniref:Lipoprotein n=1 Tax=Ruegeria halocynthiae TaxID=985054 RepID=A0A1H3DRU1_9RHOB|nr:hypothetical protein SAMN05444358_10948 [Ruegeria halocynthiae]